MNSVTFRMIPVLISMGSIKISNEKKAPCTSQKSVVLVHGGADDIPLNRAKIKLELVKKAAKEGYRILNETQDILSSVEKAINIMEDNEYFNAGFGSVLNSNGEIEMDALIMEGKNMNSGSVCLVNNVIHPISLARIVLEKTPHTIIAGAVGINNLVTKFNIETIKMSKLITPYAKAEFENFIKNGGQFSEERVAGDTVGCVVMDNNGHLAAGTSTGGLTGKLNGRIGDSPIPGSGGYCDDNIGAVSTTGHGESILKYNLSHRILSSMESGKSAQESVTSCLDKMQEKFNHKAGAIVLSNTGDVGISFNSKVMPWAYQKGNELHFGLLRYEHFIEKMTENN